MKYLILLISLIFVFSLYSQTYSTGLIIDTVAYNRSVKTDYEKTRADIPSRFDLTNFAPEIGNQGQLGSCVSWATSYYGLTIVKGIENGEKHEAFSPLSVYNRHKLDQYEDPCSGGSYANKMLSFLMFRGAPLSSEYKYAEYCHNDYDYTKYEDCLYDFNTLKVNEEQIKLALSSYSPVIILMWFYKGISQNNNNQSSLSRNLISKEGEWLFTPSNDWKKDGGHAMCVIGYDDNKFGGAFLVANSWGNIWGDSGFFWVKYNQLNTIYGAYAMVPEKISEKISGNEVPAPKYEGYTTQKIKFMNNCKYGAWISLAQKKNNLFGYFAEGWYKIEPNSELTLDISERIDNDVYWMAAMDHKEGYSWNGNAKYFCTENNAFEIPEIWPSCDKKQGFYLLSPENEYTVEGTSFSCTNVRGGEQLISFKVVEGNPIDLNLNWDGTYPLKDPVSNEIIVLDFNSEQLYDVFLLSESGNVSQVKVEKNELIEINELKFISKLNAEKYLLSINKD